MILTVRYIARLSIAQIRCLREWLYCSHRDWCDSHIAVYLIYDFVPGAETIEYRYLQPAGMPLPEPLLWSIFVQLATALRAVHSAGFAARCVDSSKVHFHQIPIPQLFSVFIL